MMAGWLAGWLVGHVLELLLVRRAPQSKVQPVPHKEQQVQHRCRILFFGEVELMVLGGWLVGHAVELLLVRCNAQSKV
jgi:hypothetical protein